MSDYGRNDGKRMSGHGRNDGKRGGEVKRMDTADSRVRLYRYLEDHIEDILKEPVGFIRYPFVDPGSVYEGNVWDWDTYWSVYGLLPLADRIRGGSLKDRILRHAKGNVYNFLDHQLEDGYIPMMIEVGRWPEPYLNMRHREGVRLNMHKPFLCRQICLISEYEGDYSWTRPLLPGLERYFQYYRTYYHDRTGLYVWHDDIMIGMDNDPASFGRRENSTANIFLNTFMVMELRDMARLLRKAGKEGWGEYEGASCQYESRAQALAAAIQEEMYDKRDGFFYSVDVDVATRPYDWFHQGLGVFWKSLPIKIRTWSGFLPLLAGIATREQAGRLAVHARDRDTFYSPFGLTTLARDERMFDLRATNNPSNWLGPIWLVANYAVFRGLLDYGFVREAEEIAEGSLRLLGRDLEAKGCLHEYYDPDTGEPIMNGGFINWNILALNMAEELEAYRRKEA